VTERTGLSQDVLRVWERRYSAVVPARGAGGQRLYSDADIERLGLLQAATRAGRSISRVASLSVEELADLVDEDLDARERRPTNRGAEPPPPELIELAILHARSLDSASLDDALRRSVAEIGVSAFIELVAAPLLRRVGEEWHAGRLTFAQEHLVSSLLHDIIAERMRSFGRREGAPRLLVATPAGERHAIGAVLVGATAAVEGWNVLYLGADLPARGIAEAALDAGVQVVAISIVYVARPDAVVDELRLLRTTLPADITLIAGGAGAGALASQLHALGARVESSIQGLLAELRRSRLGG
jgi:DNA-binding transcriptional MerR regulator/methylmalonyl-CoA mutase cobalamin-binding subunit